MAGEALPGRLEQLVDITLGDAEPRRDLGDREVRIVQAALGIFQHRRQQRRPDGLRRAVPHRTGAPPPGPRAGSCFPAGDRRPPRPSARPPRLRVRAAAGDERSEEGIVGHPADARNPPVRKRLLDEAARQPERRHAHVLVRRMVYPKGEVAAEQRHLTGAARRTSRPRCSITHSDLSWMLRKKHCSKDWPICAFVRRTWCGVPRTRFTAPSASGIDSTTASNGREPVVLGRQVHEGFADRLAEIGESFALGDIGGTPDFVPPGSAPGMAVRSRGAWPFPRVPLEVRNRPRNAGSPPARLGQAENRPQSAGSGSRIREDRRPRWLHSC